MKTNITILTTCLFLSAQVFAATAEKPNILFIMVDEMKWNVMSCAGHQIVKTPHLDQLARQGTRFATAYTVAPICTPSRYSFFTSRYAHVHGSTDNSTPPREPQVMLPSILKRAGYQTAISGKLHFISPHNVDYGFELAAQLDAWQKDSPAVPVIDGLAPEPKQGTPVVVEKVNRKDRKPKPNSK